MPKLVILDEPEAAQSIADIVTGATFREDLVLTGLPTSNLGVATHLLARPDVLALLTDPAYFQNGDRAPYLEFLERLRTPVVLITAMQESDAIFRYNLTPDKHYKTHSGKPPTFHQIRQALVRMPTS